MTIQVANQQTPQPVVQDLSAPSTELRTGSVLAKEDELILVVKRSHLFAAEAFQGFSRVDFGDYLDIINRHKEFKPRSQMEQDPLYKQIIPYLIFEHAGKYFLMQRHKKASEQRLQSKFSLGIGGHIRQEDIQGTDIFGWAQREFYEEVNYAGNLKITPLGVLNDDSNAVGQVHIGFVLLVQGDSADISVKSELQSGEMLTKKECELFFDRMETWSQLLQPALV